MFYDREGNRITLERFDELVEEHGVAYKRVAATEVGEVWVSTVWLGVDHNYDDGPPLIFETMILGGPNDGDMWRYTTEDEARAGHERVVALVREGKIVGDAK